MRDSNYCQKNQSLLPLVARYPPRDFSPSYKKEDSVSNKKSNNKLLFYYLFRFNYYGPLLSWMLSHSRTYRYLKYFGQLCFTKLQT